MISVNTQDNLCLLHACIAGINVLVRNLDVNKKIVSTKKYKNESSFQALQLCALLNFDLSITSYGIREINLLSDYFIENYNLRIVVFTNLKKDLLVEPRPYVEGMKSLNLLLEHDHFYYIKSLTALFSISYFCEFCLKSFSNSNKHVEKCIFKCNACFCKPCSKDIPKIECDKCHRKFFGEICLKNHIQNKTCDKFHFCSTCGVTFDNCKNKTHTCAEKYCRKCEKSQPIHHECFTPLYEKKFSKKKILYCFFDFETTQDEAIPNKTDMFYHKVNLVVAKYICDKCMSSRNPNCLECNGEPHIFYKTNDIDSIHEFMNELVQYAKKFFVIAISHNGGQFDMHFIMKYCIDRQETTYLDNMSLCMKGLKIFKIELCKSIRFIDSLNFFSTALANLPGMFGLNELKKGYFPHQANSSHFQNYEGVMLPMSYYTPEEMSEKNRLKFLVWYKKHISTPFLNAFLTLF